MPHNNTEEGTAEDVLVQAQKRRRREEQEAQIEQKVADKDRGFIQSG